MTRQSTKVSKKTKLSKSKINYRKTERTIINRRVRRESKSNITAFGSEQNERDYLNSDITRYYANNR